ncbi:S8 family serine peptidase [bacterium]|nr:S8 family serine peptidase [bacterium]
MKNVVLVCLAALLTLASAASALEFENSSVVGHVQDRVLVVLEPGLKLAVDKASGTPETGRADLDALSARYDAVDISPLYGNMAAMFDKASTRVEMERWYAVDFARDVDLEQVIVDYGKLAGVTEVRAIEICKNYGTAYFPDDLTNQWYLRNPSLGGGDVRALGGWAEAAGDSNVIIAVADSGVDWNHPDLGGPHPDRVNGAIWTNWDEYYGTPGVDDDANGYIDDIRGWDWVTGVNGEGDQDDQIPDNDPSDFESHGTNCAGTISPLTDNGIGVAATARGCKMMALRIGYLPAGADIGVVRMDWASQAFFYAAANGAKIFNASWGSSSLLSFGVREFLDSGGLIFTAAGNDDSQDASYLNGYPDGTGSETRILGVAATGTGDGKASFSNYGEWVDLCAPGTNIYTTAYSSNTGESTYSAVQGTSFASPLAAGCAALIWSANPGLTAAQVSQTLRFSCDDIDDVNPAYAGLLGHGRINLTRALGDSEQLVPQEYADIRDAMSCASPGDMIKVLGSATLPNITIIGRELEVSGGWDASYTTRDVENNPTVIDANAAGPALEFFGDVTASTVVDGFALEGGGGRTFSDIPYPGRYGGGVLVSGQSPTLRNLTITGAAVGSSSQLGCGGGIMLHDSESVLEDITITGNTATLGAGVFVYQGSPALTRVVIDANTLITDDFANEALGGGLHVLDADVTLTDVTVTNHLDAIRGGGIYAAQITDPASVTMTGGEVSGNTAKSSGGGVYAAGAGLLDLTDVAIAGNGPGTGATFMSGGGVYVTGPTVVMSGVSIQDNTAQAGGGMQLDQSPAIDLSATLLTGNESLIFGGTIYLTSNAGATMTNLTIADNASTGGGAGINSSGTPLDVANTIVAFNTGGTTIANGINITGASAILACNDVFGNDGADYGGVDDPTGTDGNISVDPLFCDVAEGDYRVAEDGPCAPDQSGGCGLIGALEAACGTSTPVEDPQVPAAFAVEPNFPNPFNPVTTIRFAIPTAARTTVTVFDVRGRVVKTLVDAELPAATHAIQWRGQDDRGRAASAGIYFYKVTSGEHTAVGRMALIK